MKHNYKIAELVNYNLWANKRLIAWLEANNEELITQECPSSFPSILKTIKHILDGQLFYYSALKEIPIEKPWDNSVQGSYNGLIEQSIAFVAYAKSQNTFNEPRFVKTKTLNGRFPQFELIQHCMNHSSFHRGQIITMGHQLGLTKAPSTDMLFYFIKRDNHSSTRPST